MLLLTARVSVLWVALSSAVQLGCAGAHIVSTVCKQGVQQHHGTQFPPVASSWSLSLFFFFLCMVKWWDFRKEMIMIGCFVEMVLGKDRSWLTGGWSHFRSSPPELESFGRVGVVPQGRLCLFCCFQLSASEGEVCDELRLSSSLPFCPLQTKLSCRYKPLFSSWLWRAQLRCSQQQAGNQKPCKEFGSLSSIYLSELWLLEGGRRSICFVLCREAPPKTQCFQVPSFSESSN